MKRFFNFFWSMPPLKKKGALIIMFLLIIPMIITSCWKDRFDTFNISTPDEWSPDICAPLIHSQMTMRDVLNDYDHNNLFVEDASHFLYLVYWNKVFSQSAGELMAIPVQNVNTNFSFSIPGAGSSLWGDASAPPQTVSYSFVMPYNEQLDKIVLNDTSGGIMHFNITSNLNFDATIHVSIPAATKGGVPLNKDITYYNGLPSINTIDLSGYQILLDNTFPNVNKLDITYTVTAHGNGSMNSSPYSANLNESFQVLSFHELYGDFKQHTFSVPNDTVQLRIFANNVYGFIDFEKPSARVYATNSYGVPIRITVSNFRAYSPVNPPNLVVLTGYPVPWDIPSPSLSQIGQTDTTSFTLDKDNSNLKDAINLSPHTFIVDFSGQTNPLGGPSSNFVVDTNHLTLNLQVELPLHGKAWDFRVADTFDFKFFDQNMDMVEFLYFRVNTVNGFPVDGTMQIYFYDDLFNLVDSLFVPAQQVLNAAPVQTTDPYRVITPVSKLTEVTIEQPRVSTLANTKKIVVLGKLATVNNGQQIVKIYSDYMLDVRIAARAKFKVNL